MQLNTAASKLRRKGRELARNGYQFVRFRAGCIEKRILIVGAQRSGTTMLGSCFANDIRVKDYGEYGLAETGLRILPLDQIESIAKRQHAPIMVFKPLVESHRTVEMLDFFPNSAAVWMLRRYEDVANSSLRRFGVEATNRNLGAIARHEVTHWTAEGASDAVREVVGRYFREDMPPLDGKALIWFARNSLYFDQALHEHPRVRLLRYSEITGDPEKAMRGVYNFAGLSYPQADIVGGIHGRSVGLGKGIQLHPDIRDLCEDMWSRFERIADAQAANDDAGRDPSRF
ncbi:MAG: sulfotransferase domain-containing protein [Acidimicrobiia bacterium]